MSKRLLNSLMVTLLVISFCSLGYSQTRFGIRGGLNLANISEDVGGTEAIDFDGVPIVVDINQSNRTTFNVGGLVEFRLSPMFALQVNALYNQKGMKLEGDFNTVIIEQEGEAMGEKVGPITIEQEEDIKESFETFDLAINVGAGVLIPLGNVDIFVDAQYSFGLTKINKESITDGEDIKNQVIMIDVGIIFGGK
jgi:hypothetical protein